MIILQGTAWKFLVINDGLKCSVESLLIIFKALLRNCPNKTPSVPNTRFVYVQTLQIVFTGVYLLVSSSSVSGATSEPSTSQGKVMTC